MAEPPLEDLRCVLWRSRPILTGRPNDGICTGAYGTESTKQGRVTPCVSSGRGSAPRNPSRTASGALAG
eukprot:1304817-Alexandrium_andersonii.AAC.1